MNRFKAAAIHLGISIVIALLTYLWLRLVWYPGALFTLMGGLALLIILLGVDVVIGPLITLVIFDTKKKHLKWDLLCVAAVQAAALAYGIYTMWLARPVWIAYTQGEFQVVAVPDIAGDLHEATHKELQTLPTLGPGWIGILDKKLRGQLEVEIGLKSGGKISAFPQGWQPYENVKKDVLATAKPLELLAKEKNGHLLLETLSHSSGARSSPLLWLPLTTRSGGEGIVIIDAATGMPVNTFAL